MSIAEKISTYHGALAADEHHRYRSWEHCYGFFRRLVPAEIAKQPNAAALQLGFYLASWGMYRWSSFLLKRAYTVHLRAVDRLVAPQLNGHVGHGRTTDSGGNSCEIRLVFFDADAIVA